MFTTSKYHHLESKHKAEMATAETLMLNDKHQNNSIEVSANQKREQQFCKNTKDRLANESLESCGLSDMKFKYQSDLKNHQRTHSGVFHPDNKLKTKSENHIGSGFMCKGFFLSDSNIKLADRKYPLN